MKNEPRNAKIAWLIKWPITRIFNKAEPPWSNSSEIIRLWNPCHISKWSVKINGRESANGDFPCAKLENAKKKIAKYFFGDYAKNPEHVLINMFRPTYMPNLVTLAWKMSSGMSKEAGSLNGPLCAYLMRQDLHDRTCPRSWGNKCPPKFENDLWKIMDVRVLTGLVCPAARPPARSGYNNTPEPLRVAG